MFTKDEQRLLEQIQMSKAVTDTVWNRILQKSHKKRISKLCFIGGACILLLTSLLPPVRTYAEELWKKSWFYSNLQQDNSKEKRKEGNYIVFPDSVLMEDKLFSSIFDISEMLSIPLLECERPIFDEVYYQPSFNDKNQLVTLHLWGHNKQDTQSYIPKKELYEKFTDTLTKAQRTEIENIYKMSKKDIASYYSSGVSYSITMYAKESGVTGDVRTMASDKNSSTYFSKALQCEVLIEKLPRMDGTYTISATWMKDDILYSLIGYKTADDMKKIVESMHY